MCLKDFGIIAETLDKETKCFVTEVRNSLAYRKTLSRVGGMSDPDVVEVMMNEARQLEKSPKNWSPRFAVVESSYATKALLTVMEHLSDSVQGLDLIKFALFLGDNTDWNVRSSRGWFKDTPESENKWGYIWETDPSRHCSCFVDGLISSIIERYMASKSKWSDVYKELLEHGSFYADPKTTWPDVYNEMLVDGWFLSHHTKSVDEDSWLDIRKMCREHFEEMIRVKFTTFPQLLRYIATEAPEVLVQPKQVFVLVKAYRTSLLRNFRLQHHNSAVEWLKFYSSQGPIRSNDLKETLFFLLLERFNNDDGELIRYVEQHTPDDMKRDSTLTLDRDMAFTLMQYLDYKSVIAFASTSKRNKDLIETRCDKHWKTACRARFEHLPLPVELPKGFLWYDVFQYMHLAIDHIFNGHGLIPYGLGKYMRKKRHVKRLPSGTPKIIDCFFNAYMVGDIKVETGSQTLTWSQKK